MLLYTHFYVCNSMICMNALTAAKARPSLMFCPISHHMPTMTSAGRQTTTSRRTNSAEPSTTGRTPHPVSGRSTTIGMTPAMPTTSRGLFTSLQIVLASVEFRVFPADRPQAPCDKHSEEGKEGAEKRPNHSPRRLQRSRPPTQSSNRSRS